MREVRNLGTKISRNKRPGYNDHILHNRYHVGGVFFGHLSVIADAITKTSHAIIQCNCVLMCRNGMHYIILILDRVHDDAV